MVGLAQLVHESLTRHGVETNLDPRRLQWSKWFRCEDSFSVVRAPSKPGVFALAEEVVAPGESAVGGGRRMLALFQISETDDVGMALGRLFLPGTPERKRFAKARCFARYAVVEDKAQRQAAHAALQQWMSLSVETASSISSPVPQPSAAEGLQFHESSDAQTRIGTPAPLPSGF